MAYRPAVHPVPLSPVVSASLADQVYARLRAAVQDGSLRRGEKITERDLAARLEVSPTPVREALRQLIHERVVERTGPRSLRIADYGAEAVREVAEMEARLCGLAARFAARKRSDALLAELARDLDEADGLVAALKAADGPTPDDERLGRVLAALRRFHRRIETAAGNPVMVALLAQSRVFSDEERHLRTAERIAAAAPAFEERHRQHRDLLDAIAAGDEDRAEAVSTAHHLTALQHLSH
jgi:DNA-binding GntR family transcriptional regulator